MTDTMNPAQRHYCMSQIRSRNTKPELKVRQWLWHHGYRYRLNVKSVPGKPDIVMRKYHTAIFVNGCFWHGHGVEWKTENGKRRTENLGCCRIPETNTEFWEHKIWRNQERDEQNYRVLRENGLQVIVVWECELQPKRIEETMTKVELQLNERFLELHRHKRIPVPYQQEPDLPMAAEPQVNYQLDSKSEK